MDVSGFQILYFRFNISDFVFQIQEDFRCKILDFILKILDFRFLMSDFRFKQISDFGFQILDSRFWIPDFRFQILTLGLKFLNLDLGPIL